MDANLNSAHINSVYNKLRRFFFKFRKLMSIQNLLLIYYSKFHSIMSYYFYSILIYARMQRVIKMIFNNSNHHHRNIKNDFLLNSQTHTFMNKYRLMNLREIYVNNLLLSFSLLVISHIY